MSKVNEYSASFRSTDAESRMQERSESKQSHANFFQSSSIPELLNHISSDAQSGSVNPENLKWLSKDRQARYELFEAQTKFLMGKILTVIDAAISDKDQRKALKDLIKQQFYEQQKHVYEICTGNRMICAAGESFSPLYPGNIIKEVEKL